MKYQNLFTVKSLVTFFLTLVFGYLAVIQAITPDKVVEIYMIIIAFYFGTQKAKSEIPDTDPAQSTDEEPVDYETLLADAISQIEGNLMDANAGDADPDYNVDFNMEK